MIDMTSSEKFDTLLELQRSGKDKLKIITVDGKEWHCKLLDPAEDEDDWAYHFADLHDPLKFFILECNYIESIEVINKSAAISA